MNKYLIISLIVLSGCTLKFEPKFTINDCVQFNSPGNDSWEKNKEEIEKVIEIGEKSYRLLFWSRNKKWEEHVSPHNKAYFYYQDYFKKIECPKNE